MKTIRISGGDARNSDFLIGSAILICGFFGAAALVLCGLATTLISRFIYINIDLPAFCVAVVIVLFSAVLYRMGPLSLSPPQQLRLFDIKPWQIALIVLVVISAAVGPVYHGYALSMDEYMTRFQAAIFAAGRLAGEVPIQWRYLGRAFHHDFAAFDAASGLIYSTYRPGMAAIYAAFNLLGLGRYASAVMSAGSVVLVASIARSLWPRSHTAPVVAALMLATSQQVLITGLTSYAMPAHLFFNLLWLRLFLVDRPLIHVLAALVGVATAALHQVHMHLFFAAPFLLSLFRPYRPRLLLIYGVIYAVGHALIIGWDQFALGGASTVAAHGGAVAAGLGFIKRVTNLFRVPGVFEISSVAALIVRLFAWQNLALVPLLVIAVRRAEWSRPLRLSAASVGFSILPYVVLMPDQGYGWGYRYLHGLLGNLALIATAGWLAVEKMDAYEKRRTVQSLLAAGVLSVVVMLPLRTVQVERMVAPFADAYAHILASSADVAVIDTPSIFSGQDLVRNGPFLQNRPVLLDLRHLDAAQLRRICTTHSVALFGAKDLARFGLLRESPPNNPPPDRQKMLNEIKDSRCAGH